MNKNIKVLSDQQIKELPEEFFDGKIEGILNEYRIIISPGVDVFSVNDIIQIVQPALELGNSQNEQIEIFNFVKAELIITDVFQDYAIAYSKETKTVKGLGSVAALGVMSDREVTKELNINEEESLNVRLHNIKIEIGDFVKVK